MKNIPIFNPQDFKKSSLCCEAPGCVEVAHKNGIIALRDTKNPQQSPLYFNKDEWTAFIAGIKNEEFNY